MRYQDGDTGHGVCGHCRAVQSVTYRYRTLFLQQSRIEVPNVLVGVCDHCDDEVVIPHQEMLKIQAARLDAKQPPV